MKELRAVHRFFYRYRGRFLMGVVFVIVSNVFAIVPAQLVRIALDTVGGHLETLQWLEGFALRDTAYAALAGAVLVFIALIVAMTLLKGFFLFLMRQTLIVTSRCIEYDQKNEIFSQYLSLSPAFYQRQSTGDLMSRISEDVSRVRMYYGPAIMYTINLSVLFVLVVYAMFHVNARLAWYVLAPLPVLTVMIYFVQDVINRKSESVQAQLSNLATYVQETFSGVRVIKSFVREEARAAGFDRAAAEYKRLSMDLARTHALFFPSLLLMVGLSTLLTLFIGGLEVMRGRVTMGNIAEFVIYINMLTWPVASLGWVVTLVQRAAASQGRINEFMRARPDVVSPPGGPAPELRGGVAFDDVTFTYPGAARPALEGVSFSIPPGGSLAVTGRTGSGKTTLAALLMRSMDPMQGAVRIDDRDLRSLDLRSYRGQAALVPQDVFLFSDTVFNNIAFGLAGDGLPADARQRVEEAARLAAVHDDILSFPHGYETQVGERGITLSGGQKQRISMARALVRRPRILVFDDCLSAVDTKTEEAILANLQEIMKGRTTVVIGHRISSVRHAGEILVLDRGRVAERGRHDELLARGGLYARLYAMQLLEEVKG
jgi:ATP-binding cassette subfamily B protein